MTVVDRCTSVSLQLDEMTLVVMHDHASAVPDTWVELELGASVARMRTPTATSPDTAPDHRRSLVTSRSAPSILEAD